MNSSTRFLSGGQKRRLAIACMLAMDFPILVLDEPTNDLDMDTLDLLQEMLDEYQGTILLISHDRDFLDKILYGTGNEEISFEYTSVADAETLGLTIFLDDDEVAKSTQVPGTHCYVTEDGHYFYKSGEERSEFLDSDLQSLTQNDEDYNNVERQKNRVSVKRRNYTQYQDKTSEFGNVVGNDDFVELTTTSDSGKEIDGLKKELKGLYKKYQKEYKDYNIYLTKIINK